MKSDELHSPKQNRGFSGRSWRISWRSRFFEADEASPSVIDKRDLPGAQERSPGAMTLVAALPPSHHLLRVLSPHQPRRLLE